jgi:hypothetical protein
VPQVIIQVFVIMLYENVFQNPELFPTQDSLSPEKSTLVITVFVTRGRHFWARNVWIENGPVYVL